MTYILYGLILYEYAPSSRRCTLTLEQVKVPHFAVKLRLRDLSALQLLHQPRLARQLGLIGGGTARRARLPLIRSVIRSAPGRRSRRRRPLVGTARWRRGGGGGEVLLALLLPRLVLVPDPLHVDACGWAGCVGMSRERS